MQRTLITIGIAAEAELSIEPTPVRVRCLECDAESDAAANRLLCGRCGAWHTQLLEGEELVLQRLELAPAAAAAAA